MIFLEYFSLFTNIFQMQKFSMVAYVFFSSLMKRV